MSHDVIMGDVEGTLTDSHIRNSNTLAQNDIPMEIDNPNNNSVPESQQSGHNIINKANSNDIPNNWENNQSSELMNDGEQMEPRTDGNTWHAENSEIRKRHKRPSILK